jgi:deoxyguanosine kinase
VTDHHYIVIEGPLGVGKTSLAKLLSQTVNAQVLLEDTAENPVLPGFYRNPRRYAFQTQMFFLLKRYHQVSGIRQIDLFKSAVVSDCLFEKDRLYARMTLDDNEFWIYEQLFHLLRKNVPGPDLVIFLQARTEVLQERIRKRDRKYERGISHRYLENINLAFNEFFFHYADAPLLVVNASEIDFVNVPGDLEDLVEQIHKMKTGTRYYVPISPHK